jgi:hypothetical protein
MSCFIDQRYWSLGTDQKNWERYSHETANFVILPGQSLRIETPLADDPLGF